MNAFMRFVTTTNRIYRRGAVPLDVEVFAVQREHVVRFSVGSIVLAAASLSLSAGCTQYLPNATTPAHAPVPRPIDDNQAAEAPVREGFGRVAFNADRLSRISVVAAESNGSYVTSRHFLCTTPCVAQLPLGAHDIEYGGGQDADGREHSARQTITVTDKPSVAAANLGSELSHPLGTVAGALLVVGGLGGVLLGGLQNETSKPLMSAGMSAFVGGIVMLVVFRTEVKKGASMQYQPPDGVVIQR